MNFSLIPFASIEPETRCEGMNFASFNQNHTWEIFGKIDFSGQPLLSFGGMMRDTGA